MNRASQRRHHRRHRRATLDAEPLGAMHLLTSRLLPMMVALAMCLVPVLAQARTELAHDDTDTHTDTYSIQLSDTDDQGTRSIQVNLQSSPGAETWAPCADQKRGQATRLCPSGKPRAARIADDPTDIPLVDVTVDRRRSPCPGMASHRAAVAAAERRAADQPKPYQRCSRIGRTGRILLGVLLTWYALGMLLGVLLFMRRTLRDDDDEQQRGDDRRED